MAIDLVQIRISKHHIYACVINDIRMLLCENGDIKLEHTLQEANACANWLANQGANEHIAFKTWESPPTMLAIPLHGDIIGFVVLRV